MSVVDTVFKSLTVDNYGGAIGAMNLDKFSVNSSTFYDCSAAVAGGAVYESDNAKSAIANSVIDSCTSMIGGGYAINGGTGKLVSTTITDCGAS